MTDKELLELAAKAAGIPGNWNSWRDQGGAESSGIQHTADAWNLWNPLTDDGDALRLVVKLGIEPRGPSRSRSVGRVVQAWYPPDGNPNRSACAHVIVPTSGDRYAATRRAIVRAAAEIGMAMP